MLMTKLTVFQSQSDLLFSPEGVPEFELKFHFCTLRTLSVRTYNHKGTKAIHQCILVY